MTTISPSLASTEAAACPKVSPRNLALDRTRTFLTLVVVFHHSVIPYTYFGHTDPKYWLGFDMVVLATDSFFMAMFFFLSGLFVWPSLVHKAPQTFLRDRPLRLGLPFVIAAFTIIPIAYYAIELRQHPDLSFSDFWWKTVTKGPWPSGPLWFVWVLMVFDLTASVLYRISPNLLDPINRLSLRAFARPVDFFVFLVVVTAMVYVPLLVYYGPSVEFAAEFLRLNVDLIVTSGVVVLATSRPPQSSPSCSRSPEIPPPKFQPRSSLAPARPSN